MTIPEAASLIIQAGAMAKGGEIFILDMGKPIKITDLARDLIRLSGLRPDIDIKIKYTGLRPGEKLYEELLLAEEGIMDTAHGKIFIGKPVEMSLKGIMLKLEFLEKHLGNEEFVRNCIMRILFDYSYSPAQTVSDRIAAEN
jgi:FlaA1/EpsC-like NDP-sugar epimerase